MNVGFVGLGVMGSAMARRLAEGGHAMFLYDAGAGTLARVATRIEGAVAASSPADVARNSEIVFTMLPNGEIVREVVFGRDGLAEGLPPGALFVDTSSAEPWITRETAQALAKKGVDMLDAPVSGAQEGAETGTLVFMAGGAEEALDRARPLLELMGGPIFHLGPVGSGHVMKTINNLATALTFLGTTEGMLIGKAWGLKPSAMVDVLNVSTGVSFFTQKRLKQDVIPRRFEDAFKLELMLKDIGIAIRLAGELGLSLPVSELGRQEWAAADELLGPGRAATEIVRWYEDLAGVELKDD